MNVHPTSPGLQVSIEAPLAGRSAGAPEGAPDGPGDAADRIILSIEARRLARAGAAASAAPGERAPLVNRLRTEVQSGAYRIDVDALARALVDSMIV